MNRFSFALLLCITIFAGSVHASKKCDLLLANEIWPKMNPRQKMVFLEKNQKSEGKISSGKLKGARVLRGYFVGIHEEELKKICPTCRDFVDRLAQSLIQQTPKIPQFEFTDKFLRNGPRAPLASVLVAPDGTPLGAYVYLVREFYWRDPRSKEDLPFVVENNWVDGYFDWDGTFLGRGENIAPQLGWAKYGLHNERNF